MEISYTPFQSSSQTSYSYNPNYVPELDGERPSSVPPSIQNPAHMSAEKAGPSAPPPEGDTVEIENARNEAPPAEISQSNPPRNRYFNLVNLLSSFLKPTTTNRTIEPENRTIEAAIHPSYHSTYELHGKSLVPIRVLQLETNPAVAEPLTSALFLLGDESNSHSIKMDLQKTGEKTPVANELPLVIATLNPSSEPVALEVLTEEEELGDRIPQAKDKNLEVIDRSSPILEAPAQSQIGELLGEMISQVEDRVLSASIDLEKSSQEIIETFQKESAQPYVLHYKMAKRIESFLSTVLPQCLSKKEFNQLSEEERQKLMSQLNLAKEAVKELNKRQSALKQDLDLAKQISFLKNDAEKFEKKSSALFIKIDTLLKGFRTDFIKEFKEKCAHLETARSRKEYQYVMSLLEVATELGCDEEELLPFRGYLRDLYIAEHLEPETDIVFDLPSQELFDSSQTYKSEDLSSSKEELETAQLRKDLLNAEGNLCISKDTFDLLQGNIAFEDFIKEDLENKVQQLEKDYHTLILLKGPRAEVCSQVDSMLDRLKFLLWVGTTYKQQRAAQESLATKIYNLFLGQNTQKVDPKNFLIQGEKIGPVIKDKEVVKSILENNILEGVLAKLSQFYPIEGTAGTVFAVQLLTDLKENKEIGSNMSLYLGKMKRERSILNLPEDLEEKLDNIFKAPESAKFDLETLTTLEYLIRYLAGKESYLGRRQGLLDDFNKSLFPEEVDLVCKSLNIKSDHYTDIRKLTLGNKDTGKQSDSILIGKQGVHIVCMPKKV
jgi:hypothetical protein